MLEMNVTLRHLRTLSRSSGRCLQRACSIGRDTSPSIPVIELLSPPPPWTSSPLHTLLHGLNPLRCGAPLNLLKIFALDCLHSSCLCLASCRLPPTRPTLPHYSTLTQLRYLCSFIPMHFIPLTILCISALLCFHIDTAVCTVHI